MSTYLISILFAADPSKDITGKWKNKLQMLQYRNMRRLLIIFILFLTIRAAAPDVEVINIFSTEPVDLYDKLIRAIIKVESKGDTLACNLTEQAFGAFQIRPIRLQDYNQRTGKNYRLEDLYNFEISKEIFIYYAKKIGYPDYESIARNWNGSGKTTLEYWKKVKSFF